MQLILIIEDDQDNCAICRAVLEHRGYKVHAVHDGQTGIAAARAYCPALILLDIGLPVMDGWEVARALKADPLTSGIPIVAVTAHAYSADREMAETLGFARFMPKPLQPISLAETVRELIGAA